MLSDYFRRKDLAHSPEHWNVISENHPISMLVLRANRARLRRSQNTGGLGRLGVNIIDWLMMCK